MARGKGQKRREAAYQRAHQNPNATLPAPPKAGKDGDIQGDHYIPRSLRNLLDAKARAEGKANSKGRASGQSDQPQAVSKGPLPLNEANSSRPTSSVPAAAKKQGQKRQAQQEAAAKKPIQAVQHKKVREGRARYLKAKKDKQKQKRSDEWAQQADPGIQDKPGFGEQTLAPPKAALKRKHWSESAQSAAALGATTPALQQAAVEAKESAILADTKRQKSETGRATMASLKRLVAQQAAARS